MKELSRIAGIALAAALAQPWQVIAAEPFNLSDVPLFLAPGVKPNLMVILDNSQSMDATMSGMIISGDNAQTRSNIARGVLKTVLAANINSFNWGLSTFETGKNGSGVSIPDRLYNLQPYYLGDSDTMVYTNNCAEALAATLPPGKVRKGCVANPQPGNGFTHITYAKSGDDPDVNDLFYTSSTSLYQYGVGVPASGPEWYTLCSNRNSGTTWASNDFSGCVAPFAFTPTDAGFLFTTPPFPRVLFIKRDGWGWAGDFSAGPLDGNNVSGKGKVLVPVKGDFLPGFVSGDHKASIESWLATEMSVSNTGEIKNSALFTPLAGSLKTVRDYFIGQSSSVKSPVSHACQKNFVVLATDGNPTADENGNRYTGSNLVPDANGWNNAQKKVFDRITDLRETFLSSSGGNLTNAALTNQKFDIKTYIVGMGDTVDNPQSIAALNKMALDGGAHPTAFLGNSQASLASAFNTIANDIKDETSSASSAAVNSGSWNDGSRVYQAKFTVKGTDWSGDLIAFPVTADGAVNPVFSWRAATQLAAQNWNSGRKIITYKPSQQKGVPFRWPADPSAPGLNEIDAPQVANLGKDGTTGVFDSYANGALRLAYLRGDTSREPRICPACTPQFRDRVFGPLGDIVNSAPFFVGAPSLGYADDLETAAYSTFAFNNRNRAKVIYVGANDGMLHAINAANGNEILAYVPSPLYGDLTKLTSPSYVHRYYVDGSPTVGDVFYDGAWHTLLVSGMRAGAKGLFALDVTDPATFSNEDSAQGIVRWELQDSDLGHVYGQPLLVKTNYQGKWAVVVGGGYKSGNADGNAVLFVIDAETGQVIRRIDTRAGTPENPNGLSAPAAVDLNGDGDVDLVYAGDLNGNLWKFDLTSSDFNDWEVGNDGDPLFSAEGSKPITATPDVTRHPKGGFLIGFGTGRYLATSDHTGTGQQSVYAIRDNLTDSGDTVTVEQLQQQSILPSIATRLGVNFRVSTHAVGEPSDAKIPDKDGLITRENYLGNKMGWYIDLPTSGERVVADAAFRAGRMILVSMIPDATDPCKPGGSGWLLEFDAITGNRLGTVTFNTNNDAVMDASDLLTFTEVLADKNLNASGRGVEGIPAAPAFISNGLRDFRLINADEKLVEEEGGLGAARNGRAMWREVR